jgi:type II secretory pathway pseudopilin PulG
MTLLEMVVAVAVLSIGVVGVLASFGAIERTAAVKQGQAQLEVAVREVSDFVRGDQLQYKTCAAPSDYTSAVGTAISSKVIPALPADVSWSIPNVYLATSARCPGDDSGLQEIRIQASSGGRSLSRIVWKASTGSGG